MGRRHRSPGAVELRETPRSYTHPVPGAQEDESFSVCFFGTYRAGYVRNEVMIAGLEANDVTVHRCHSELWHGVEDRVEQAAGGWMRSGFVFRVAKAYWRLWRRHRHMPDYDVMLIGYPGQFDALMGRLLAARRGRKVALDVLMSLHLIAVERGLTARSPLTGRLIRALEGAGLRRPHMLLVDTPEYRDHYRDRYGLPEDRFRFVPLGVDDRLYHPLPEVQPPGDIIRVIYHGTFIRLHGVPTVLDAADRLRDRLDIRFDFYGEGQEEADARARAEELELDNVHFHGWVDKQKLPEHIAASHIVLGVFGTTKQARCTIQNKIWEGMMMSRAVISGDAETIRQELEHRRHVYLVPRADPDALAEGIATLADDESLRAHLGEHGHVRALENDIAATGRRTRAALAELVTRP
jgi:glycosyltransferase involved in cell wall biosynthesis